MMRGEWNGLVWRLVQEPHFSTAQAAPPDAQPVSPPPSPWPFKVGDVVTLKSGGGSMVVEELLCGGDVRVIYWCDRPDQDTGHLREADLDPALLFLADTADDLPF